ncbi:hypothetical protein BpHYR1_010172, partial [Brachionus plicatilis]
MPTSAELDCVQSFQVLTTGSRLIALDKNHIYHSPLQINQFF